MNIHNYQPMMSNQLNSNLNRNELINNLVDQNNQMINQISINNNMLKSLLDSNMDFKENKKQSLLDKLMGINFFPRYEGNIINVIFEDNTGKIKLNIAAPNDTEMKDLLVIFYIKMQIYGLENEIKIYELKDYLFLFNSRKIYLDEKASILDYGLKHNIEKIYFFLENSIIGG